MKYPIIFFGFFSFIFSGVSLAAETPTKPGEMGTYLNLNKQQKKQIIQLHATAEECFNNIDAGEYQPRLFLEMVKKGKVDEAIFDRQMAIQNKLHDQSAHCKISYYTSVSNILTAEQKQKLVEMYQKGMQ